VYQDAVGSQADAPRNEILGGMEPILPPNLVQVKNDRVYIVILTWNQYALTADCLRSLKSIEYQDSRIVVVDNASQDGTVDKLRSEFGDQIDLICSQTNLGYSEGNNVGIRHALEHGAGYVMLLNNDTTVHPGFVAPLLDRFSNGEKIGATTSKILYMYDPSRIWAAGGEIRWWAGTAGCRGENQVDKGQYDLAEPVDFAQGCCMLCSREALESVGLLDNRFFIYFDDVDWSLRCREAGLQIWYEPASIVWHVAGQAYADQAGSDEPKKKRHKPIFHYLHHRNGLWFFRRHGAGLQQIVCLSTFTLRAALFSGKLILQGRIDEAGGVWRGLKDGWFQYKPGR
jgi:GT2 family glycosyltransferase